MATKKKSQPNSDTIGGFSLEPLMLKHLQGERKDGQKVARVYVAAKGPSPTRVVEKEDGIEVYLAPLTVKENEIDSRLKSNAFVRVRDAVGASVGLLERMEVTWAEYHLNLDKEGVEAALIGLEMGLYRFKRVFKGEIPKFGISVLSRNKLVSDKTLREATYAAVGVNLARHLVNLPPNILNPVTYADGAQKLFSKLPNLKVEVWDEKRLAKERMNLHLAVGQGSQFPPRLVHLQYRPRGAKKAPIALVGKGITFDTGGVDIKPSSGMRLMKKDMGGSATLLGLAYWAAKSELKVSLDFYLALAENSVDGNSFRPSDVVFSRNGTSVEIHNTDAEGRLVLADAMDVAATQKETPRILIDIATLTGAIKVALGANLAGLFANDNRLAQSLASAGQQAGDLAWVMPLFQKYRSQLNSHFADQINSVDGFGGAVTAALFLEKFAKGIPWAHFDIYAWKDSSEGPWLESGGSGQSVLGLKNWLETQGR